MSNNAANYEIQDGGPVCRIILPPRKLGKLRRLAWIPLILGGVTLLFMVAWISTPLWWGIDLLQKGQWFGLLLVGFAMTGLFGLRTGLLMVAGGIAALRETTASTLEIRLKTLVCIEEFGPLKWRRKIRIRDITKLSLGSIAAKGDARQLRGTLQGLAETESVAVHQVGKEFHVAVAYPREILIPLANELAERLDRQQDRIEFIEPAAFSSLDDVGEPAHERPRIAVELGNSDASVVPTQPVGSTIVKHEVDGSTVFQVPPTGIWQGSRGLMFFAILWNGFMTAWTLGLFAGGGFQNAQGAQGGGRTERLFPPLFSRCCSGPSASLWPPPPSTWDDGQP